MDFLTSLVNSMPGAVAQGLIWGIMAIGVYITYRILDVADLTVDGSLGTGGAVCVVLVLNGRARGRGPAGGHAGGYAGGPCHGPVPHGLRHPGHSGRHSDPAGAVFHQPAHHGHRHGRQQGQPGRQCGQVRPAGLGPLCPRAGAQQPDLRAAASAAAVADRRCCTGSSARSWAAPCAPPAPTSTWPGPRASTRTSPRCWA